jgi:hypothetical protein
VGDILAMGDVRRIDYVILNAGILRYPNVSIVRVRGIINILMI